MVSTVILCGMSFFPSKSATGEVNSELKNLTSQISQFVSFLKVEEDEDKIDCFGKVKGEPHEIVIEDN